MKRPLARLSILFAAAAAAAALAAPGAGSASAAGTQGKGGSVPVRLVSINDFHGNMEPPSGSGGRIVDENGQTVEAGGAAYMATHLKRISNRNTLTVAAGDLIGATPLMSAAYHDEPTVDLLGRLGLTASAVGNHEFDEGYDELLRIQDGGCHPEDGCSPEGEWDGAKFDYLGANVLKKAGGDAVAPYTVRKIKGVRIGFIGLVTQITPSIVSSEGIKDLEFTEEVAAADRASKKLAKAGVKAQVLLVHEGDQIESGQSPDACSAKAGAGTRIAKGAAPEIDYVAMGHSHQAYVCTTEDPDGRQRYFSQGSSFGRVLTQVDFEVDRRTRDVIRPSVKVDNHVVTRDVTADAEIEKYVATWKERSAAIADKPIGKITESITRDPAASGETPLGNLIADAQLAGTKDGGNAVAAFMNPGGVRADLTHAGDGTVTYGEAFTVQPFSNVMGVVTLTGAQLDTVLEQQFTDAGEKILAPSASVSYTLDRSKAIGDRVSGITIDGTAVSESENYRIAANNFLLGGGDGFTEFTEGTDLWNGPEDLDALVDYFGANSPVSPPATDRITVAG